MARSDTRSDESGNHPFLGSCDTSSLYRRLTYSQFITSIAFFSIGILVCPQSSPQDAKRGWHNKLLFASGPLPASASGGTNIDWSSQFTVALDIDETVLQQNWDGDITVKPEAKKFLEEMKRERDDKGSRLNRLVLLSSGTESKKKFRLAGLEKPEYYFDKILERPFMERTSPGFYHKDLSLVRAEVFKDSPRGLAARTIIVLVDNYGRRFDLFNKCHKENENVISFEVETFNPYNISGYSQSIKFGLKDFQRVFTKFIRGDKIRLMGVGEATKALSEELGRTMPQGIFNPIRHCPFVTELIRNQPEVVQKDVIDPVLVTDAQWILSFLKNSIDLAVKNPGAYSVEQAFQDLQIDKGSNFGDKAAAQFLKSDMDTDIERNHWDQGREVEMNLSFAMMQIARALSPVLPYTTALVVYCSKSKHYYSAKLSGGMALKLDCPNLERLLAKGFVDARLASPPIYFSSAYWGKKRSYDLLPIVRQELSLSEHRTVVIGFDAPATGGKSFTSPSSSAIGFFNVDMKGIGKWRCKRARSQKPIKQPFSYDNLHQFILKRGVGNSLEHLTTFAERLRLMLQRVTSTEEISSDRPPRYDEISKRNGSLKKFKPRNFYPSDQKPNLTPRNGCGMHTRMREFPTMARQFYSEREVDTVGRCAHRQRFSIHINYFLDFDTPRVSKRRSGSVVTTRTR